MKKVNCWIFMLVILFLSSCGNKVRNKEISGITSFHPSNSYREMYITSYGNMILSRWVKTIQGHSVKTSTLEKAER